MLARTVREPARLSLLNLATWLAGNWWRLRWEPEGAAISPSWRMSHALAAAAAAGGGYLWPDVTFASEGDAMRLWLNPTPVTSKEHIRYLSALEVTIPSPLSSRAWMILSKRFWGGSHKIERAKQALRTPIAR